MRSKDRFDPNSQEVDEPRDRSDPHRVGGDHGATLIGGRGAQGGGSQMSTALRTMRSGSGRTATQRIIGKQKLRG